MLTFLIAVIGLAWLAYLTGKIRHLEAQVEGLRFETVPPIAEASAEYSPPAPAQPEIRRSALAPALIRPTIEIEPPVEAVEEETPRAAESTRPPAQSVFEDLFGGRLPIWAGGITLAVAAVFLVRYSIDTGLLPPIARVLAGLVFGFVLVGGAEAARRAHATAHDPRIAQALAGAGIASAYVSILAAIHIYDLIGPLPGFLGLAAITGAAMLLALRFGAACAVLGLVGGLAAPALVGASEPNVPGMAFYLMLVIGGLGGIARRQRWLWLSVSALLGGFGWAGLLMFGTIDTPSASALSVLLLILAFALPTLAGDLPFGGIVRLASLAIGGLEVAALVARGGYAPLEWGFYGLLGVGSVVLARIDRRQIAMPPVALAIALGTVAAWPAPLPGLLAAVLGGIIAIFAIPALIDARHAARGRVAALQGAAALCLVPLIAWLKLSSLLGDTGWASLCLGLAGAAAVAARSVWNSVDERFAALASGATILTTAAAVVALPLGAQPSALAAIACLSLWIARQSEDARFAWTSRLVGLLIPAAILVHVLLDHPTIGFDIGLVTAGLGLACAGHVERSMRYAMPWLVAAPMIVALALDDQFAPALVGASLAGAAALLALVPAHGRFRPLPSTITFAGLAGLLVVEQIGRWLNVEAPALLGAMVTSIALPSIADAMLRLALPGALLVFAVVRRAPAGIVRRSLSVLPVAAIAVALHIAYRHAFAQTGLSGGAAERILLTTLLLAAGGAALGRAGSTGRTIAFGLLSIGVARTIWFEMIVCNPLLQMQSIGSLPMLNWLAPAYLLPAVILFLVQREPSIARLRRPIDMLLMLVLLQFVAATVRQLFHGAILVGGGVTSGENALRSLAGIATAIGFLVYGLRRGGKDWRIAGLALMIATVLKVFLIDAAGLDGLLRILSFVALGLSLIGIGWLHSRLSDARPASNGSAPTAAG